MKPLPPQALLHELFDYDPETGVFIWRSNLRGTRRNIGLRAGSKLGPGYVKIRIYGYGDLLAHRLAWVYVHGSEIGELTVDHIDGNPSNNAIANLRLATPSQQVQNLKAQSGRRSHLKGAMYRASRCGKTWQSQISVRGTRVWLGLFHTPEEAHTAYAEAALKYFGEFARLA